MTVSDPAADRRGPDRDRDSDTGSLVAHVGALRLFAATGLAPVAWVLHLVGAVVLVNASCETGHVWPVHVVTGVTAVASLVGLLAALDLRSRAGQVEPGEVARRMRFLSTLGIYLGALFLALIVVESVPIVVLEPCTP